MKDIWTLSSSEVKVNNLQIGAQYQNKHTDIENIKSISVYLLQNLHTCCYIWLYGHTLYGIRWKVSWVYWYWCWWDRWGRAWWDLREL